LQSPDAFPAVVFGDTADIGKRPVLDERKEHELKSRPLRHSPDAAFIGRAIAAGVMGRPQRFGSKKGLVFIVSA
jgi:hypothetical protein